MRSVFAMVKGAVLALCMISLVVMPSMAGAATVKGLGSRVELLASGTDTTVTIAAATLATVVVPAWCDSVEIMYRIDAVTVAGTGLQFYVGPNISDDGLVMGSSQWLITAAAVPAATAGGWIGMGKMFPGANGTAYTLNGLASVAHVHLPRYFKFGRVYTGASATTSIRWFIYCYGG